MAKKNGEKLYSRVFRQVRAYILQNNLQPGLNLDERVSVHVKS